MTDIASEQRHEESKRRASALVTVMDLLGKPVDADTIQRAALVQLGSEAMQAVANLAYLALMNLDTMAAILDGRCSEEMVGVFARVFDLPAPELTPNMLPAANPRLAAAVLDDADLTAPPVAAPEAAAEENQA